ncbi:MAG: FAD-dependent oxidoreductase [Rhodospirillaceae bacterium]|nr:FAD-dependent oxidoreductase [Rhodospirillaceae bacterium]
MIRHISKRTFLKSAGLAAGALMIGARSARATDGWDVIVIGGGTAGLPTAIFAAERGARVLLIEKSGVLGGTLDRSAGQIAGAGTVFQEAKSIADSADAHFADIMRISRGTCDPVLARILADNAGATINWLAENGFTTRDNHPVIEGAHEAFSTARYLWGPEGGRSIMKVLVPKTEAAVAAGKITALMHTGAVELTQSSDGAVTGVITEDAWGARTEHKGRNVVLASGGCASNPAMFEELHGVPLYARVAYPYSQGKGIALGVSAGGVVRGGEKYLCNSGTVLLDNNFPSPIFASAATDPRSRQPWEIIVNRKGERFVREDHPSVDAREHALLKQPGMRSWLIFDQEILDKAPPLLPSVTPDRLPGLFNTHPMFTRADTLAGLAKATSIGPEALVQSVANYNVGQAKGADVFGRTHLPLPIAKPPFYAVAQQGMTIISFAGLTVDEHLRVTDEDGAPIPNLYAVGEVIGAGATSGNAYTNGMLVTPALTFGRLLGQRILPLAT